MNNERGIAGLAQSSLMTVKMDLSFSTVVESVYYAVDSGATVINMSFGAYSEAEEFELALAYAEANGVTAVAGAGNSGHERPFYPAAWDTVIAVSATTREDTLADFSNFGDWLGVAAPGHSVLTTNMLPFPYHVGSGTSLAGPYVTALVALMHSIDPSLSPRQTRGFIYDHADDLGDPGFDIVFGHGRINAYRTLRAVEHALRGPSDLNDDGTVDFFDLLLVLAYWGTDHYRADIDEDGVVRFEDLIVILDAWGPCSGGT
jgi:subtilisin family serine protease